MDCAAADLIDELVSRRPVTQRQMMLLRFWDRLDLATSRREELSQWIDDWHSSDDRRWIAWDMLKARTKEADPEFVPVKIESGVSEGTGLGMFPEDPAAIRYSLRSRHRHMYPKVGTCLHEHSDNR